jgi:hypothetical protein
MREQTAGSRGHLEQRAEIREQRSKIREQRGESRNLHPSMAIIGAPGSSLPPSLSSLVIVLVLAASSSSSGKVVVAVIESRTASPTVVTT